MSVREIAERSGREIEQRSGSRSGGPELDGRQGCVRAGSGGDGAVEGDRLARSKIEDLQRLVVAQADDHEIIAESTAADDASVRCRHQLGHTPIANPHGDDATDRKVRS